MLSIFPEILFLAPFAALALRLSLTVVLLITAWAHVSRPETLPRVWALAEAAAAVSLLVGAWTQPVALFAAAWLFASMFFHGMRIFPKSTIALALIIALSLVVTGPGAFALDLPL
ncbi:MAG: hypothetical protein Athens041674_303 [Parcubacteria group bacterium Athens0416_74]|nr:MAG: hypothetical protein Athens041674_303 [Parcubacteria group bacterium Athens0416_74]